MPVLAKRRHLPGGAHVDEKAIAAGEASGNSLAEAHRWMINVLADPTTFSLPARSRPGVLR